MYDKLTDGCKVTSKKKSIDILFYCRRFADKATVLILKRLNRQVKYCSRLMGIDILPLKTSSCTTDYIFENLKVLVSALRCISKALMAGRVAEDDPKSVGWIWWAAQAAPPWKWSP